jgi:hypothetical protein
VDDKDAICTGYEATDDEGDNVGAEEVDEDVGMD